MDFITNMISKQIYKIILGSDKYCKVSKMRCMIKKKKKTPGDATLACEVCKAFEDVVFEFRCEWCSICILCIPGVGVRGLWP